MWTIAQPQQILYLLCQRSLQQRGSLDFVETVVGTHRIFASVTQRDEQTSCAGHVRI